MNEFFTVPYVDDRLDNQTRFQKSVLRTETPLHIQPFLSAGPAMTYLHGKPPFENRNIYPLPAFLLCSADLKAGNSSNFVARIRSISTCAALPIIMLGKGYDDASVSRCYAAGADHFIHNPRAPARLDVIVQALYACAALATPSFDGLSEVPGHQRGPQSSFSM